MKRKPVAFTRFAVSGFMLSVTVLRSVGYVLPLSSDAMTRTSRSFRKVPSFSTSGRLEPLIIVESTTVPFGAGPLKIAAVEIIGKPGKGNGLSIASLSSGDAVFGPGGVVLVSGALPRGAT